MEVCGLRKPERVIQGVEKFVRIREFGALEPL